MRRVLFVDDEPRVLEGLRDRLRHRRSAWDMAFVSDAQQALDHMRKAPFDVIVSDMRMPGLDGAALLSRVQHEFPSTVRIILSGYTEREAALRAVPVAHQFLTKPCEADVLQTTIDRACDLLQLISDPRVRAAVGRVDGLPCDPVAYTRIVQGVTDESLADAEVAELLHQDMATTAKVLQLANSSFFGPRRRNVTTLQAVKYLGRNVLEQLVPASIEFPRHGAIPGIRFRDLQQHSLLVGTIAERITTSPEAAGDAQVAGILHDIGILVIAAHMPEHFERIRVGLRGGSEALYVVEREVCGVTHAELGAYLLGLWNLPSHIVDAVALHHHAGPGLARNKLAATVNVANSLAHMVGVTPLPIGPAATLTIDPTALETAGITRSQDELVAMAMEARHAFGRAA